MSRAFERAVVFLALLIAPFVGFFGALYLLGLFDKPLVNVALGKQTSQSSVYEAFNAYGPGGVDGVKDGGFGFHTNDDDSPWWAVDLGREYPLRKIVLYNTTECCEERSRNIAILLSTDGQNFTRVYQNDGEPFGGVNKGKPLVVKLNGQDARYVRLQLPDKVWLHMDEVEVYAREDE